MSKVGDKYDALKLVGVGVGGRVFAKVSSRDSDRWVGLLELVVGGERGLRRIASRPRRWYWSLASEDVLCCVERATWERRIRRAESVVLGGVVARVKLALDADDDVSQIVAAIVTMLKRLFDGSVSAYMPWVIW